MSIVSSAFVLDSYAQKDGRKYCREVHTDIQGKQHLFEYLSTVGADNAAILSARATKLGENLKAAELYYAVFSGPWDYVLVWATNAELAAYVRRIYKESNKETLAKAAARILEWISKGRFTDTQVRGAFGLNSEQLTTLKAKMQTLVNNYNAVETVAGE